MIWVLNDSLFHFLRYDLFHKLIDCRLGYSSRQTCSEEKNPDFEPLFQRQDVNVEIFFFFLLDLIQLNAHVSEML